MGDAKDPTDPEKGRSAKTWFRTCLYAWIVLLPLSAWAGIQEDFAWRMLSGPVDAMTGAFGAVVIGALLFDQRERRIERERALAERRAWLRRNLDYAVSAQGAMLRTLADLANEGYGAIAAALGPDQIPDDYLRNDITKWPAPRREPKTSEEVEYDLASFLQEIRLLTGPLNSACKQVARVTEGFRDYGRVGEPEGQEGVQRGQARGPKPEQDAIWLTPAQVEDVVGAFTPERLERLRLFASGVHSLAPDVSGFDEIDPRELRASAIGIGMAVQDIVNISTRPIDDDEKAQWWVAGDLVLRVWQLLVGVSAMRDALWRVAKDLSTEAQKVGGVTTRYVTTLLPDLARSHDMAWDMWREGHGFAEQDRDQVPVGSDEDG